MGRTLSDGRETPWIAAHGWGGQRIFVIPDLDLVVVITAAMYGSPRENSTGLEILGSFVVPAVRDRTAR